GVKPDQSPVAGDQFRRRRDQPAGAGNPGARDPARAARTLRADPRQRADARARNAFVCRTLERTPRRALGSFQAGITAVPCGLAQPSTPTCRTMNQSIAFSPVHLSAFAQRLKPETAFDVLAVAKRLQAQGKDVIELQIGDSPFPSPHHALTAGVQA